MATGSEKDADYWKSQLTDKVKLYENKLAAINAINSALQKENDKLRKAAGAAETSDAEADLLELQEEFAKRLGTADRQLADLKEDKTRLQAQLSLAVKASSASEARLQEMQGAIEAMKGEGAALASRNGELEASTRKLRTQWKEAEAANERLSSKVKLLEQQLASAHEQAEREQAASSKEVEMLRAEVAASREAAKQAVEAAQKEVRPPSLSVCTCVFLCVAVSQCASVCETVNAGAGKHAAHALSPTPSLIARHHAGMFMFRLSLLQVAEAVACCTLTYHYHPPCCC